MVWQLSFTRCLGLRICPLWYQHFTPVILFRWLSSNCDSCIPSSKYQVLLLPMPEAFFSYPFIYLNIILHLTSLNHPISSLSHFWLYQIRAISPSAKLFLHTKHPPLSLSGSSQLEHKLLEDVDLTLYHLDPQCFVKLTAHNRNSINLYHYHYYHCNVVRPQHFLKNH